MTTYSLDIFSFPNLERVCCSMSSSNCCFLACIQISEEAGKVVWYPHLFKNFPQFVVIHTVKSFSSQWSRCFWGNSLAFSVVQQMLAIWPLVPLPFLNPAFTSASSRFTYCGSMDCYFCVQLLLKMYCMQVSTFDPLCQIGISLLVLCSPPLPQDIQAWSLNDCSLHRSKIQYLTYQGKIYV